MCWARPPGRCPARVARPPTAPRARGPRPRGRRPARPARPPTAPRARGPGSRGRCPAPLPPPPGGPGGRRAMCSADQRPGRPAPRPGSPVRHPYTAVLLPRYAVRTRSPQLLGRRIAGGGPRGGQKSCAYPSRPAHLANGRGRQRASPGLRAAAHEGNGLGPAADALNPMRAAGPADLGSKSDWAEIPRTGGLDRGQYLTDAPVRAGLAPSRPATRGHGAGRAPGEHQGASPRIGV